MQLPKTSLKVVYIEPEKESREQDTERLTKFITLFAQVGYKEISLNKNSSIL